MSRPALLPAQEPPSAITDLKIPESFLANLIVKHAFYLEVFTLPDMTSRLKLNSAIVMHLIDYLRREKYVEVRGSASLNGAATAISQNYRYALNDIGKRRAAQLFEFDNYVGRRRHPGGYWRQVEGQSIRDFRVNRERLERGFAGLIIADDLFDQFGPAVVSGKPIFIYGPPGNGKTAISLRLGTVLEDTIMVPYALFVEAMLSGCSTKSPIVGGRRDGEFFQGRCPLGQMPPAGVLVGGEMTLEMLDLNFNPILKYYEAPLQLKANNGLFIVDDFGRHVLPPRNC